MIDSKEIFIRLYIDEDVHGSIGAALRRKGYDVISVHEVKRDGLSDADQLSYAVQEDRAIFSFNAVDYIELHIQYLRDGKNIQAL